MNDKPLAEIQERCEAATPGPWVRDDTQHPRKGNLRFVAMSQRTAGGILPDVLCEANAADIAGHGRQFRDMDFIAHARQDIPDLLAMIAARDAKITSLTAAILEWIDGCERCSGIGTDHYLNEITGECFDRPCPGCTDLRAALETD